MLDFTQEMQTRITDALVRLGVSAQVADMVGAEITQDLCRAWSGEQVYFGKREIERARLRDEVRRRFNGRNAREIARELGIGRATVYRYIKLPGRGGA